MSRSPGLTSSWTRCVDCGSCCSAARDHRQDELATDRQRLADQLPAEHQREVEHLVHQPLLVLADGGVERGQQRCQAGALGAGLREAGGVAGGATLGQRRGAHRRELGFARRRARGRRPGCCRRARRAPSAGTRRGSRAATDFRRTALHPCRRGRSVPSSARRRTIFRISFCSDSTSRQRTGPLASRSSRSISAARCDMFLKIFSRSSSEAPLSATISDSDWTSRSSDWMPRSSTSSRFSNTNISSRIFCASSRVVLA